MYGLIALTAALMGLVSAPPAPVSSTHTLHLPVVARSPQVTTVTGIRVTNSDAIGLIYVRDADKIKTEYAVRAASYETDRPTEFKHALLDHQLALVTGDDWIGTCELDSDGTVGAYVKGMSLSWFDAPKFMDEVVCESLRKTHASHYNSIMFEVTNPQTSTVLYVNTGDTGPYQTWQAYLATHGWTAKIVDYPNLEYGVLGELSALRDGVRLVGGKCIVVDWTDEDGVIQMEHVYEFDEEGDVSPEHIDLLQGVCERFQI